VLRDVPKLTLQYKPKGYRNTAAEGVINEELHRKINERLVICKGAMTDEANYSLNTILHWVV
jgi:hypothetical protein